MVGWRADGEARWVQRDQKDSTCGNVRKRDTQKGGGRTYRAKGGYFFDALLIIDIFVAGSSLLSEIEDPPGGGETGLGRGKKQQTYIRVSERMDCGWGASGARRGEGSRGAVGRGDRRREMLGGRRTDPGRRGLGGRGLGCRAVAGEKARGGVVRAEIAGHVGDRRGEERNQCCPIT